MHKVTFRLLIAAVMLLSASNWFYARKAKAASKSAQVIFGQPACRSFVPSEWGEYKGSSSGFGVAFQDSSGTLRFVTNVTCESVPTIALQIQRGTPK
ncbi:MAG: hypothetical protein WBR26_26745 [Candidatus Acidiferrum sp.]